MKKIILLLLFPVLGFAQSDTIKDVKSKLSVIGLDKMNVVYRGVPNPISIAVNNAKSYKITGNGVSQNEEGKYVLRAGSGTETKVFVEIEKIDGSKVIEEHSFRIKGLPAPIGTINEKYSENRYIEFKRNDFKNALVGITFIGFLFDIKLTTISYSIKYKKEELKIEGNIVNDEAFNFFYKIKKNSIITFDEIRYPTSPETLPKKVYPIVIKLID